MLGIIGGSGLDQLSGLEITERLACTTPYGEPSADLVFGILRGQELVFLPRHGADHSIAPHRINYRANLWALHAHGVRNVVAVSTVGGITKRMVAGALVVPDQVIDYTHGRESTYFDGIKKPLQHIDFTLPFCADMRRRLLAAGRTCGFELLDGATYGATQGPRLETAAEINRMERDGADIVGMTGMPEAVLARELGLGYAMLAVVVNPAAGKGNNAKTVSLDDILTVSDAAMKKVRLILDALGSDRGD
jgi:5'-methylthioadenosine phosphorylase